MISQDIMLCQMWGVKHRAQVEHIGSRCRQSQGQETQGEKSSEQKLDTGGKEVTRQEDDVNKVKQERDTLNARDTRDNKK